MPLPPQLTVEIPRMDGATLRVDDAAALAEVFFATEISSLGPASYDARTLTTDPDGLDREDITVLNRSFRAMIIKVQVWQDLMDAESISWLTALGRDWDLITMSEEDWAAHDVISKIENAIAGVVAVKYRGVAQATKMLHLKRPRLVPVIDSYVARAIGGRLSDQAKPEVRIAQARQIVEHFRDAGRAIRPDLEAVDAQLRSVGVERSLARILDCLIWCSEAEAWQELQRVIARWRAP